MYSMILLMIIMIMMITMIHCIHIRTHKFKAEGQRRSAPGLRLLFSYFHIR